jgi:hypothetical protein
MKMNTAGHLSIVDKADHGLSPFRHLESWAWYDSIIAYEFGLVQAGVELRIKLLDLHLIVVNARCSFVGI